MLKCILILCLWIGATHNHDIETKAVQSSTNEDKHITKPSGISATDGATYITSYRDAQDTKSKTSPEWIIVYITGAYTVISLLSLFVIWNQNRSIQNAERPWILLSIADQFSEYTPEGAFILAHWKVKNFGKTPALIDSITGAVAIVEDLSNIPDLQFKEPFTVAFEPVIAPQNESSNISFRGETVSRQIAEDLLKKDSKNSVVIAGRIKYRDSFNRQHTSSSCYSYVFFPYGEQGFNRICGPKNYNEYT